MWIVLHELWDDPEDEGRFTFCRGLEAETLGNQSSLGNVTEPDAEWTLGR